MTRRAPAERAACTPGRCKATRRPERGGVRVSVADVSNHRLQFGLSLRDPSVAQWAVPAMLFLRHEMDAQHAVSIGRVVAEAPKPRSADCWTMLVPLQGARQQLLVFGILWNTVEEAFPLRGTRYIRQSEAPAQVREPRDGCGSCQPTQLRVCRGNAKLQIEVVFIVRLQPRSMAKPPPPFRFLLGTR